MANVLNTRIRSKIDYFSTWQSSNFIPLLGEICIAIIPRNVDATRAEDIANNVNTSTISATGIENAPRGSLDANNVSLTPYAIGMKVGDGANRFRDLPWIQAIAGDVYGWAKKAVPEAGDIKVSYNNNNNSDVQTAITGIEQSLGNIVTQGVDPASLGQALADLQEQLKGENTIIFESNPLNNEDPPVATYPTQIIRSLVQNGLSVTATGSALTVEDLPNIPLSKISDIRISSSYNSANSEIATIADINSVIAQKIGNALTFIGKSTTEIKEGLVENYIQPTINGEVITTGKLAIGDVVLWRSERIINAGTEAEETIISDLEFVWTGPETGWELIGDEGSYAIRGSIRLSDLTSDLQSKINEINSKLDSTTAANTYVAKNGTDRLMTAAEGTKLAGIAEGAQVNTIEKVKVNGTELSIDSNDKSVNVEVPVLDIKKQTDSGAVSVLDNNKAATFSPIAFDGDVKYLTQTDTILIFDCGSASDIITT